MPRISLAQATVAALLAVAQAGPAAAERRVYAGSEAQALKCAAYYSYTAHVMERRGIVSTLTAERATQIGIYILQRHVSGSWDQKMMAYEVILKRMPSSDWALIDDTARHLDWCKARFLR